MLSDAYAGRREHYLDLCADEEARSGRSRLKMSSLLTLEELVERLSDQSCIQERIISVEEYIEPTGQLGILNLLTRPHYFIILQTLSYWWSMERKDDTVVIQRAKNFSTVHSRCKGSYRHYRWLLETGPLCSRAYECTRGPKMVNVLRAMINDGVFNSHGDHSSSWEFACYVVALCTSQALKKQLS